MKLFSLLVLTAIAIATPTLGIGTSWLRNSTLVPFQLDSSLRPATQSSLDPPYGPVPSLYNELHRQVDKYVTDLADESVRKCEEAGVRVKHSALKTEWRECSTRAVSTFFGNLVTILFNVALSPELAGLDSDLFRFPRREPLSPKQRRLVKRMALGPLCYATMDLFKRCELGSYETLSKAAMCNTKAEEESRRLAWTFARDVCRGDMGWLIDFSEAVPLPEFVEQTCAFANTDAFREKLMQLLKYEEKGFTVGFRRIATQAEFCSVHAAVGELLTGLFVTPAGNESRAADILRRAFRSTIGAYKEKCSALSSSVPMETNTKPNAQFMYSSDMI